MSQFAYPASLAFQDVIVHGSKEAAQEMKEIVEEEKAQGKVVPSSFQEAGEAQVTALTGAIQKGMDSVCVLTRSGAQARKGEQAMEFDVKDLSQEESNVFEPKESGSIIGIGKRDAILCRSG